jgi:superfamily II DNA or RNA helicase
MATGLGKTHLAAHLINNWKYRRPDRPRALFLAQSREIVGQNAATLEKVTGEQVGVEMGDSIASGHSEWGQRIICASVQTLRKAARNLKFNPDDFGLVVCDEAHHSEANSYAAVFNRFHQAARVGLTATPDRGDKKTLARNFDVVAFEYNIVDGIRDGWLVPLSQRLVTLTNVSFDDIRTVRRDLDPVELADAMVGEGPLHGVVRSLFDYCGSRSCVVFASSVGHGHLIAELLNRSGYGRPGCAWSADCHTDKSVRAERLAAYERGEFQFLVNYGLFTEGWDSTRTSAIAIARPTKSRSLFAQMVGRGTRICSGCVGLDPACSKCGGKQDLLVLGYTPETTRHRLISTVDLLLPPGAVADAVAKRLPKEKAPLDIRKAAAEEAARLEEERRISLERMVARAEYESRIVDPFGDKGDLFDQPANAIRIPTKAPASAKAKKFLKKHGVDIRGLTKADANTMIRDFHRRVKDQLWTFKQESLLSRFGWGGGEVSKARASEIIEQIKQSGWRMLA